MPAPKLPTKPPPTMGNGSTTAAKGPPRLGRSPSPPRLPQSVPKKTLQTEEQSNTAPTASPTAENKPPSVPRGLKLPKFPPPSSSRGQQKEKENVEQSASTEAPPSRESTTDAENSEATTTEQQPSTTNVARNPPSKIKLPIRLPRSAMKTDEPAGEKAHGERPPPPPPAQQQPPRESQRAPPHGTAAHDPPKEQQQSHQSPASPPPRAPEQQADSALAPSHQQQSPPFAVDVVSSSAYHGGEGPEDQHHHAPVERGRGNSPLNGRRGASPPSASHLLKANQSPGFDDAAKTTANSRALHAAISVKGMDYARYHSLLEQQRPTSKNPLQAALEEDLAALLSFHFHSPDGALCRIAKTQLSPGVCSEVAVDEYDVVEDENGQRQPHESDSFLRSCDWRGRLDVVIELRSYGRSKQKGEVRAHCCQVLREYLDGAALRAPFQVATQMLRYQMPSVLLSGAEEGALLCDVENTTIDGLPFHGQKHVEEDMYRHGNSVSRSISESIPAERQSTHSSLPPSRSASKETSMSTQSTHKAPTKLPPRRHQPAAQDDDQNLRSSESRSTRSTTQRQTGVPPSNRPSSRPPASRPSRDSQSTTAKEEKNAPSTQDEPEKKKTSKPKKEKKKKKKSITPQSSFSDDFSDMDELSAEEDAKPNKRPPTNKKNNASAPKQQTVGASSFITGGQTKNRSHSSSSSSLEELDSLSSASAPPRRNATGAKKAKTSSGPLKKGQSLKSFLAQRNNEATSKNAHHESSSSSSSSSNELESLDSLSSVEQKTPPTAKRKPTSSSTVVSPFMASPAANKKVPSNNKNKKNKRQVVSESDTQSDSSSSEDSSTSQEESSEEEQQPRSTTKNEKKESPSQRAKKQITHIVSASPTRDKKSKKQQQEAAVDERNNEEQEDTSEYARRRSLSRRDHNSTNAAPQNTVTPSSSSKKRTSSASPPAPSPAPGAVTSTIANSFRATTTTAASTADGGGRITIAIELPMLRYDDCTSSFREDVLLKAVKEVIIMAVAQFAHSEHVVGVEAVCGDEELLRVDAVVELEERHELIAAYGASNFFRCNGLALDHLSQIVQDYMIENKRIIAMNSRRHRRYHSHSAAADTEDEVVTLGSWNIFVNGVSLDDPATSPMRNRLGSLMSTPMSPSPSSPSPTTPTNRALGASGIPSMAAASPATMHTAHPTLTRVVVTFHKLSIGSLREMFLLQQELEDDLEHHRLHGRGRHHHHDMKRKNIVVDVLDAAVDDFMVAVTPFVANDQAIRVCLPVDPQRDEHFEHLDDGEREVKMSQPLRLDALIETAPEDKAAAVYGISQYLRGSLSKQQRSRRAPTSYGTSISPMAHVVGILKDIAMEIDFNDVLVDLASAVDKSNHREEDDNAWFQRGGSTQQRSAKGSVGSGHVELVVEPTLCFVNGTPIEGNKSSTKSTGRQQRRSPGRHQKQYQPSPQQIQRHHDNRAHRSTRRTTRHIDVDFDDLVRNDEPGGDYRWDDDEQPGKAREREASGRRFVEQHSYPTTTSEDDYRSEDEYRRRSQKPASSSPQPSTRYVRAAASTSRPPMEKPRREDSRRYDVTATRGERRRDFSSERHRLESAERTLRYSRERLRNDDDLYDDGSRQASRAVPNKSRREDDHGYDISERDNRRDSEQNAHLPKRSFIVGERSTGKHQSSVSSGVARGGNSISPSRRREIEEPSPYSSSRRSHHRLGGGGSQKRISPSREVDEDPLYRHKHRYVIGSDKEDDMSEGEYVVGSHRRR